MLYLTAYDIGHRVMRSSLSMGKYFYLDKMKSMHCHNPLAYEGDTFLMYNGSS